MLRLKNIKKSFIKNGKVINVLDDFSLNVESSEFVAIQGESGVGKSTLLFIAGSLLKPDAGEVIIDNVKPYELSSEKRAAFRSENIGFLFQQFFLLPYLSIIENILTPAMLKKNKKQNAMEILTKFNLQHRATHLPSELSVGECQRAALARAVYNQPKLLFADEPTGNLDSKNAEIILNYLNEYAKNGNAVIMVTHDNRAAQTTDKIVKL